MIVRRHPEKGLCEGGQVILEKVAHVCTWPSAMISVQDDSGMGFIFTRDEAAELAAALRECLADA